MPMARALWHVIVLSILLNFSSIALGHGGRLDASGGHNNRRTGGYHCHRCPCGCATDLTTATSYRSKAPRHQGSAARKAKSVAGTTKFNAAKLTSSPPASCNEVEVLALMANIREAASTSSKRVTTRAKGTRLTCQGVVGAWYRVDSGSGLGFVHRSVAKIVR